MTNIVVRLYGFATESVECKLSAPDGVDRRGGPQPWNVVPRGPGRETSPELLVHVPVALPHGGQALLHERKRLAHRDRAHLQQPPAH
jgi:hypothetical protein